jgi:succinate-semialdehyde dehydrogenase / glutarate-semialdehyde dehydrogenase
MTPLTDLFIDGHWRPGSNGGRFDVIDPADLSTIGRFAIATDVDCMDAA